MVLSMTTAETTSTTPCTGEYCCECDACCEMQAQQQADECAAEARNEQALYGPWDDAYLDECERYSNDFYC